jgi:hypothetical protein
VHESKALEAKYTALAVLLILVAVFRITATYYELNHTMDEPSHIACGLEWLTQHTYNYMPEQPPLSRVAAAIGASIAGAHNVSKQDLSSKNPLILYESPSYWRTLASARAAELPFFILASVVVWLWARQLHGPAPAVAAVFLFTTLPPVLGHAGLATTDMALAATTLAALYAYSRWLDNGNIGTTLLLAFAIAAGVLSKFTFLLFFPVCAAVILALHLKRPFHGGTALSRLLQTCMALSIAAVTIWAGYRFRITAIPTNEGRTGFIQYLPKPIQASILRQPSILVPAGELYQGLVDARTHNFNGHYAYLLGRISVKGWWYFFPVVLAYKTPIAFLFLVVLSGVFLFKVRGARMLWMPLACALALLISVIPSHIDLGIRHILPIYGFLAISAGFALNRLVRDRTPALLALAALLAFWQIGASVAVHPDYLAYFNEFARGRPEAIRVDSDLDWGQSFQELAGYLRNHGIDDTITLAGFGCADVSWHKIRFRAASPWEPATGWFVISSTELKVPEEAFTAGSPRCAWCWLDRYTPLSRIGHGSLLVYHIQ